MIKCNVTVCGTISKAAVVRTNNENKAFTCLLYTSDAADE